MGLLPLATLLVLMGVAAALAYRWTLLVAYVLRGRRGSRAPAPTEERRFRVLVPAHDEELLIGRLLASIQSARYPTERIEVVVVADNCRDATAERAREAGARVLERRDPANPGKGQALTWGLQQLSLQGVDAVAFVDADNLVAPGFFSAMNRELAAGGRVLQGYDGISNPEATVLTRLIAVTIVMKNLFYNGGKRALGLSCLLMGTGMVFAREVLEAGGWNAHSIGEDLEQSFFLLERGETVRFVADAAVLAQEASTLGQGYAQRQRWASGRRSLRRRAWRALRDGLRTRRWVLADAGLDLLMPTYSKLANWTLLALVLAALSVGSAPGLLAAALVALALELAEFGLGLAFLGADRRFVLAVAFAPVFLAWKVAIDALAAVGFRRDRWSRTERHPEA